MTSRKQLRRCLIEVIDSYEDETDFRIFELRDSILQLFDHSNDVASVESVRDLVAQLEVTFPGRPWSLFRTTFDLYSDDLVSELPKQQLPAIDVSLTIRQQKLNGGNTRVGGEPKWIQDPGPSEGRPLCGHCNEVMAFVCQIDSLSSSNDIEELHEFRFLDRGCLYVFACLRCGHARSLIQSH